MFKNLKFRIWRFRWKNYLKLQISIKEQKLEWKEAEKLKRILEGI